MQTPFSVNCPLGTFHDKSNEMCIGCPADQYQDTEAQRECMSCPAATSTNGKTRQRWVTDCKKGRGQLQVSFALIALMIDFRKMKVARKYPHHSTWSFHPPLIPIWFFSHMLLHQRSCWNCQTVSSSSRNIAFMTSLSSLFVSRTFIDDRKWNEYGVVDRIRGRWCRGDFWSHCVSDLLQSAQVAGLRYSCFTYLIPSLLYFNFTFLLLARGYWVIVRLFWNGNTSEYISDHSSSSNKKRGRKSRYD